MHRGRSLVTGNYTRFDWQRGQAVDSLVRSPGTALSINTHHSFVSTGGAVMLTADLHSACVNTVSSQGMPWADLMVAFDVRAE